MWIIDVDAYKNNDTVVATQSSVVLLDLYDLPFLHLMIAIYFKIVQIVGTETSESQPVWNTAHQL